MRAAALAGHESFQLPGTDTFRAALEDYRRHIGHQTAGAERLEGTYPFTLARSVKAFRLNRFLHAMTVPAHREHVCQPLAVMLEYV